MNVPDFLTAQADLDLMTSRQAFAVAQAAFDGPSLRVASAAAAVSWHGTELHPEGGSVALVREDGDFADLVGEIVMLARPLPTVTRTVFAYVVGTAPIVDDISLARRPFMGLGILANEYVTCQMDVVA